MKHTNKAARMEKRRQMGYRQIHQPERLRVHWQPPYSEAYACFSCRVSFKRHPKRVHTCPSCGQPVYGMGRAFRAPKRRDEEQWAKVQRLYAYGFRFHRYGGNYPKLPERLRDVDRFVEAYPQHPLRVGTLDSTLLEPIAQTKRQKQ